MERTVLHILGGDSRSRAQQAQLAFALGHHAEVYSDTEELLRSAPSSGVVLAAKTGEPRHVAHLIEQLGRRGMSLPVVVTAFSIELEQVVAAIRAGALDYWALPLEMGSFARRLTLIMAEERSYQKRRSTEVAALSLINSLSGREREVLALLSSGLSNREMAQELGISMRTVEIHRANMMTKLGANHPADAIKAWIATGLDPSEALGNSSDNGKPRFMVESQAEVGPLTETDQRRARR